MKPIELIPLEQQHVALFAQWLKVPHVQQWYHDPEDWLAEVNARGAEYDWIHHFIVLENGEPFGFCQYYDAYDARELEDWYTVKVPGQMYSIDYLIGDVQYLGKGYGKAIVAALEQRICALPGAKQIVVQPEPENRASTGVLLANGFVFNKQKDYYEKYL